MNPQLTHQPGMSVSTEAGEGEFLAMTSFPPCGQVVEVSLKSGRTVLASYECEAIGFYWREYPAFTKIPQASVRNWHFVPAALQAMPKRRKHVVEFKNGIKLNLKVGLALGVIFSTISFAILCSFPGIA